VTTTAAPRSRPRRAALLPGPDVPLGRREVPVYRIFAVIGVGAGVLAGCGQAARWGVPVEAVLLVAGLGVLGAVAVMLVRAVGSSSDWVWHEHEAVVLTIAAAVGFGVGQPLRLLDVCATGLLFALAPGRVGCLLAGCCYGSRVTRSWGAVRYGSRHAQAGLPPHLVGVALAPVQLVEAVGASLLAAGSIACGALPPGALFVAAIGGRAGLRTVVELWRGDHGWRSRLGLSTPQIWALGTVGALLVASAGGVLPVGVWTAIPAAAAAAAVGIATVRLSRGGIRR
jgi:prolipoprotein diacylglyceryltransferase